MINSIPVQKENHSNTGISGKRIMVSEKKLFLLLGMLILMGGLYISYKMMSAEHFRVLMLLPYNSSNAVDMLKKPETIALSRNDRAVYINDLHGQEMLLISPLEIFGTRSATLRISKSRKYITWESEKGMMFLNVPSRKVNFVIAPDVRQVYDISSQDDKIVVVEKNELKEIYLNSGSKNSLMPLPSQMTEKPKLYLIKYSPDEEKAFVRAVYRDTCSGKGDIKNAVLDIKTKEAKMLGPEFANSMSTIPVWSEDGKSLYVWNKGLFVYDLENDEEKRIIDEETFANEYSYSIDPQNGSIAFISSTKNDAGKNSFYDPVVTMMDSDGNAKKIASGLEMMQSGKSSSSIIQEVGWKGSDIWFVQRDSPRSGTLWTVNKNSGEEKKLLEKINKLSVETNHVPLSDVYFK